MRFFEWLDSISTDQVFWTMQGFVAGVLTITILSLVF
jgi:hypothetical protein